MKKEKLTIYLTSLATAFCLIMAYVFLCVYSSTSMLISRIPELDIIQSSASIIRFALAYLIIVGIAIILIVGLLGFRAFNRKIEANKTIKLLFWVMIAAFIVFGGLVIICMNLRISFDIYEGGEIQALFTKSFNHRSFNPRIGLALLGGWVIAAFSFWQLFLVKIREYESKNDKPVMIFGRANNKRIAQLEREVNELKNAKTDKPQRESE